MYWIDSFPKGDYLRSGVQHKMLNPRQRRANFTWSEDVTVALPNPCPQNSL